MDLRVLGCHGGETPRHRTTAFLIDERLAIDAGALTSQLDLSDQARLDTVIVSHSHLDHVRDLGTIADNRAQLDCGPLTIAGTKGTLAALRKHFFNDLIWPNFERIPSLEEPTIVYRELPFETPIKVLGYDVTVAAVDHTVESAGFLINDGNGVVAFSGDTGPTDRLWELLDATPNLKALVMEVSFPNEQQALATLSGHHTPNTLIKDLHKLKAPEDLATMLYHIKPAFQSDVEKQCAKLKGVNLHVLKLTDQFIL
ncbi:MAG: 3',5'-cyclic-nucleotide phosphodiesterase [Deltaproteobacteria bacterium]|nr:MAG: 3',5'-cyclic-nucleotide phosphodiesterase [Deltaproteobacteria bacterium]